MEYLQQIRICFNKDEAIGCHRFNLLKSPYAFFSSYICHVFTPVWCTLVLIDPVLESCYVVRAVVTEVYIREDPTGHEGWHHTWTTTNLQ